MDIVYLVKNCVTNEELTYSLRSLSNLPHNHIFIVGGISANLNQSKVIYRPFLQGADKFANTTNGLKYICQDKYLSDDFILMNDDFFILKPIIDPVNELNLCRGTIQEVIAEMILRNGCDTPYTISMAQTDTFLKDLGYNIPLSYELHIPMVINKNKFLSMFSLKYIDTIKPGQQRSLYGNMFLKDSKKIKDVKIYKRYITEPGSDKFLSTADNSWPLVKPMLEKLFPTKSEYEI